MSAYRLELHGSTINPRAGTLRMEVPSLFNELQLNSLTPSQFGAVVLALIDTKAWLRAYVLVRGKPVAVLYRERADKFIRTLDPPVGSEMYVTAGDPNFLHDSGLAELPKASYAQTLMAYPWETCKSLQEAQNFAFVQFEAAACGAVVFYHEGEVVAAWERRHLGGLAPRLVAVSAKALL